METAEQYAGWIVQNQDKKGTPEFATVAEAYKLARGESAPAEAAAPTAMDRAKRVAGLGIRVAGPIGAGAIAGAALGAPLGGVGAIPGAIAGAGAMGVTQLIDKITGLNATDKAMDFMGVPRPETGIERFSTDVTGAMANAAGGISAARTLAAPATLTPTVTQNVAQSLTQAPGKQIAAAGMGAGASDIAAGMGAGPTGQFAAGVAGSMLPFAPSMLRKPVTPETMRTREAASAAMNKGYVLPPSQSNPGMVNNVLTGSVSGKAPTERLASLKNQAVTDSLVKKDLGVSDDVAITTDLLRTIRNQAGQAYDAVAQAGPFTRDAQFSADLAKLTQTQKLFAKEIPALANKDILNMSKAFQKNQFSGETLVEATKDLRGKATAAFRSGDTTAARFYRSMSEAVEDLMERNLQAQGKTDMIPGFKGARETIARAHSAEAALTDSGNVSARKLAAQWGRGTPLSGGMKEAARFAENFPGAAQLPEQVGRFPGVSMTDTLSALALGGGGMGYTGSPYGALAGLLPLARPIARSGILSSPYQAVMGRPDISGMTRPDASTLGALSALLYANPGGAPSAFNSQPNNQ